MPPECRLCGRYWKNGRPDCDCMETAPLGPVIPCPSCAAKDTRIKELEEQIIRERMEWSATCIGWSEEFDEKNARLALYEKVAEAAEEYLKLETDGFQFVNRQRPNMLDADIFRAETLRLIENHNNAYRQVKIYLRAALAALKEGR